MSTSEIAKLESRWRENRQGLTFAPLAEAYRKMKEPQRALEILGEGLGIHPDYIPASIVLGRCHLDLGDDAAAEDAFNRVLSLDGENVIALKALAEITERHLRFDEAEGWLRQLLAIDRSNEEARAQLVRVEDSRRNTAGIPRDEHGLAVDTAEAIITEERPGLAAPMPAVEAVSAESTAAESTPPDATDEGHDFEPAEPAIVEPIAEIESHVEPAWAAFDTADAAAGVEGLEPREFVSPDVATPLIEQAEDPLDLSESLTPIQRADELELRSSGAIEFQAPDAAADLGGSAPFLDEEETFSAEQTLDAPQTLDAGHTLEMPTQEWAPPGADEEQATGAWPELEEPDDIADVSADLALADAVEDRPAAETARVEDDLPDGPTEPELVVTESMAELYLQQGHRQEALTIYRELFLRNPADSRLRQKVDELETIEAESAPAGEAAYSTAATGGQSVAELFRALLAARPADAQAAPHGPGPVTGSGRSIEPGASVSGEGEPTRPADDRLSLSAVFGDDSSPVPPAMPGNAPAPAPDGISFDAFFDSAAPAEPMVRRPAAREDDDLDEFHAWLQNLKR